MNINKLKYRKSSHPYNQQWKMILKMLINQKLTLLYIRTKYLMINNKRKKGRKVYQKMLIYYMQHNEGKGNSLEVLANMVRNELSDDIILMTIFLVYRHSILGLLKCVEDDEAMGFTLYLINADVLELQFTHVLLEGRNVIDNCKSLEFSFSLNGLVLPGVVPVHLFSDKLGLTYRVPV